MPYDPKLKPITNLKRAVLEGQLSPEECIAELEERLARPKVTIAKKRILNNALTWVSELNDNPPATNEQIVVPDPVENMSFPSTTEDIRGGEGFEIDSVYPNVLLESYGDNRINIRPVEIFPEDIRVQFAPQIRDNNPVGTRFRANVTYCIRDTEPYLRVQTNSITIVTRREALIVATEPPEETTIVQGVEINTERPRAIESETPGHGVIRKPSELLTGLPNPYYPEAKDLFPVRGLNDSTTLGEKFICALRGLVWEIRNSKNLRTSITLNTGVKQSSLTGEHGFLYSFKYDGDEELFEGARIDFEVGHRKTKGSIASIIGGQQKTLLISLDEDFGQNINHCSLTQDSASFLESLQNRLEIESGLADAAQGQAVGMNLSMADALMKGEGKLIKGVLKGTLEVNELNSSQKSVAEKILNYSVSFIWGPPGTGKTQTLGAALTCFYEWSERSLICSNTNKAVDQVLLKLCKRLVEENKIADLEAGKIVRVGVIAHEELKNEFGEYITVEGIAKRRGSEIQKKIDSLNEKKSVVDSELEKQKNVYEKLIKIKSLKDESVKLNKQIKDTKTKISSEKSNLITLKKKVSTLYSEKDEYRNKGFLGRTFGKSIYSIEEEIKRIRPEIETKSQMIGQKKSNLSSDEASYKPLLQKIAIFETGLGSETIDQITSNVEKKETDQKELVAEIRKLEKEIEELRKGIIKDAIFVGATLTKTFLSPSDLGKFENVIIDEASMGLLPALYFVASQSSKRCIISGDFRQIPAIIQSKNKAILDIIGKDIFKYSGLEDAFETNREGKNAGILTKQYRMEPKICDLVSEIGYSGRLSTAAERQALALNSPKSFEDSVIIIDTSTVMPFCNKDVKNSTSNITHALIARNIIKNFSQVEGSGSIGFCAPFKAQVKLIKKMLEAEVTQKDISVGTVHTFQGDEKETIIFDSVCSIGEDRNIPIMLGQETVQNSEVLTVAVSRAQRRLIFLANLKYLDRKIPGKGYFREILYKAQSTGTVIDARSIIDLQSLNQEMDQIALNYTELAFNVDDLNTGLANEDTFFPILKEDISRATKFIVIYSGFYTSKRVSDLISLLREKIKAGVRIRVVVPDPNNNGSIDSADSEQVIALLKSAGIEIDFRSTIHQKVVLIDEDLAWFGSLNPLSATNATLETMMRVKQTGITDTFAQSLAVNKLIITREPSWMVEKENLICQNTNCQSDTVFIKTRQGPFWKCTKCKQNQYQR